MLALLILFSVADDEREDNSGHTLCRTHSLSTIGLLSGLLLSIVYLIMAKYYVKHDLGLDSINVESKVEIIHTTFLLLATLVLLLLCCFNIREVSAKLQVILNYQVSLSS